jgi:hypothetical protein
MSRSYNMLVKVNGFDPEKIDRIKDAAEDEWDFDDWNEYHHENDISTSACADGYLAGGETEDEFGGRLAKAIWAANDAYCEVQVVATYLENIPCETYSFDEDDFAQHQAATEKSAES